MIKFLRAVFAPKSLNPWWTLFEVHRNVARGQWANCLLFVHVGGTCVVFWGGMPLDMANRWYGTGVEIFTEYSKFRFRLGGFCDERYRKRRERQKAAAAKAA